MLIKYFIKENLKIVLKIQFYKSHLNYVLIINLVTAFLQLSLNEVLNNTISFNQNSALKNANFSQ